MSINVEAIRMAWALSLRNVQCHLEEIRCQHDVLWYRLVCKLLCVACELLRSPSQEESRERTGKLGARQAAPHAESFRYGNVSSSQDPL